MYRVGFLYNHEAAHQVAHSAPIAAQLARMDANADVSILATSDALLDRARECGVKSGVTFVKLEAPSWQRAAARVLDPALPFSRLANLARHRHLLAKFDILVVPERTTLVLKRLLGEDAPLLVHTKHGSGDRRQGYTPTLGRFDLVLLSGAKLRDRLVGGGLLPPERAAVVGYPKFDTIDRAAARPRLFANDRPTVVYNPHPMPGLSSWFDMGEAVLEHFAAQSEFNLIFAPHVMLFRRRLHVSTERLEARWCAGLPRRFDKCPHILIDTGSARLLDMTYMRAADIYLGDASSQIYEFLLWPRPAIFLNPGRLDWRGNPNFENWTFGAVAEDIGGLKAALREAINEPERYRLAQERGFRRTFDLDGRPSSQRAAAAIMSFASKRHAIDADGGGVDAVDQLEVGGRR